MNTKVEERANGPAIILPPMPEGARAEHCMAFMTVYTAADMEAYATAAIDENAIEHTDLAWIMEYATESRDSLLDWHDHMHKEALADLMAKADALIAALNQGEAK